MCSSVRDEGNRHSPRTHPCQIADAVQRPAQSARDSRPAVRREEGLAYNYVGLGMCVNVAYQIAVSRLRLKRILLIFVNIRISLHRRKIFPTSNGRRQRVFHFSTICTESFHGLTLPPPPPSRWPPIVIDELTQIDQHNLVTSIA